MKKHSQTTQAFLPPIGNLSHLGFCAFAPHSCLQAWVQCYWQTQRDIAPAEGFTEKLYPDGGTTLTFYFKSEQLPLIIFDARCELTSQHFEGYLDNIGVRFHPGGAFQLLGAQIEQTIGNSLAATNLQLLNLPLLQQQLAESKTNQQRLSLIENWLLQQAKYKRAKSGVIQHFWPLLVKTNNSLDVLTQSSSLSRRQIERKFQTEIGLSPAYVKLLHNVKFARRLITAEPTRLLTDIGLECGFYDQAHFIRQFRKVTAQTPGQYRQRKLSQIYNSTK